MREMHKWKDKVEFSLDNRQVFFLFFGLSVVGCFVFALGIMTGRRLQWDQGDVVAKTDSLQMLDAITADEDESFAFKDGLAEVAVADLPQTRDPEEPPRDEAEVKAERKEKAAAAAEDAKKAQKDAAAEKKSIAERAQRAKAEHEKNLALANADERAAKDKTKKGKRLFTLQFKAFSRAEEAETFADKLRRNGHDIRIEQHVVRGRNWHRVRLGLYDDWDNALAAKTEFEASEHIIAYVVSAEG